MCFCQKKMKGQFLGQGALINVSFCHLSFSLNCLGNSLLVNFYLGEYNECTVWFCHNDSLHRVFVVQRLQCECSNIWWLICTSQDHLQHRTANLSRLHQDPLHGPQISVVGLNTKCKRTTNARWNTHPHTIIPTCTQIYRVLYAHRIEYAQKKSHH